MTPCRHCGAPLRDLDTYCPECMEAVQRPPETLEDRKEAARVLGRSHSPRDRLAATWAEVNHRPPTAAELAPYLNEGE